MYIINLSEFPHPIHFHLVNFIMYKTASVNIDQYKNDWFQLNGGPLPYKTRPKQLAVDRYLNSTWKL